MSQQGFERQAYELGCEHAKNAASWIVDGNTKAKFIPAVLEMFEAGDPALDDYLPAEPNLSGEWASGLTPTDLYGEIVGYNAAGGVDDPDGELTASLCDEYERGVSDTFRPECERILRAALES